MEKRADSSESEGARPKSITLETRDEDDNEELYIRHGTNYNTNNNSNRRNSYDEQNRRVASSSEEESRSPYKVDAIDKDQSEAEGRTPSRPPPPPLNGDTKKGVARNGHFDDNDDDQYDGNVDKDITPDRTANTENNNKGNVDNRQTRKERPEWDMFADQDLDSTFDVSQWIVNIKLNV